MASPADYLGNLMQQAKSQLLQLEPGLGNQNLPFRGNSPTNNDYQQAFSPAMQKFPQTALGIIGTALGEPELAIPSLAANLMDTFSKPITSEGTLGSPVGEAPLGAGMNKLPIATLIKLAQSDTQNALAPTIHDVINARNNLFHATGNVNAVGDSWGNSGILNSGQINPGTGDQFTGVAMSRTPVIPEKTRQLRFEIDPNRIPPSIPTADSGYGKTLSLNYPTYMDVFKSLSDEQLDKIENETVKKYPDFKKKPEQNYGLTDMAYMSDSKTWNQQWNKLKSQGTQVHNPDYEFETRTKGKPIPTIAIKQALITPHRDTGWDTDPMELISQILQSKNPVPSQLINEKDLPLARLVLTKNLSQQVLANAGKQVISEKQPLITK